MNLFALINKLSSEEESLIGKSFRSAGKQTLEAELFRHYRNSECESDEDFLLRSGGRLSAQSFHKLKSRLFLKILDKMCSDEFIGNKAVLNDVERSEVKLKKKLLQAKILHLKTAKTDSAVFTHLLNEIIHEGKEYEFYDTIAEALSYKMGHIGPRLGYKEYRLLQEEVALNRALAAAKQQANDYYYTIVVNRNLISHFRESEMNEYVNECIRDLENSPYTTISTAVQYYYKIIKLAQHQQLKEYTESVDVCLEIISLLKRSKAIARTERFGMIYGNLSKCLIYQRNYKQAAQTSRSAQIYFAPESLAYVLTLEQEFFACYYSHDFTRARQVIELMLKHNKRDSGRIRTDMFTYYLGCLEFAEGNFNEAKKIAALSLEIIKDKPRWDLGVRYLKIMSMVELGLLEEARDGVEALRKHKKRTQENKEIGKRDELIVKAFLEFASADFNACSGALQYILKRLSLKDSECGWRLFTHEIIPVHRWMKKRTRAINERVSKTETVRHSL